jgi:DNA repair exonuclease SbcCD ATPase subunit
MVASRIEAAAMRTVPQAGKAVLAGGVRGLAAGATMAGRATYAQAVKIKPIADVMRAGGVMVGKAREALSRAVTSLQKGLENRVAKDEAKLSSARARLGALTSLEKGYQELHELDRRTESTYNRLADVLQYYDELSPEEQQDPEKMLPLALARMEYDTLVEARAEKEEQLREQLREHYEKNLIKGDELRNLKNLLRTPQIAIGSLNKMIEEQEHEVQMRKAELERDKAFHGRFARLVEGVRGVPARLRKLASEFFTIPRQIPREQRKGGLEVLKPEGSA